MKTQLIIANPAMVNDARTMLMFTSNPSDVELILITNERSKKPQDFTVIQSSAPTAELARIGKEFDESYIFLCSPEPSYYEQSVRKTLSQMFQRRGELAVGLNTDKARTNRIIGAMGVH